MLSYLTTLIIVLIGLFYSVYTNKKPSVANTADNPPSPRREEIIVHFQGKKYNVTAFAKYHPGGKEVLCENKDTDIEELMEKANHSEYAYRILQKNPVVDY